MIDRRTFLESLGLIGGTTLLASCTSAPEEKLYSYLRTAEELIPGQATFYASVCRACPAGCGLWVKTREARPIKLEGNPSHPVNRGALCSRGQAFIQSLYGPDRLGTPRAGRGGEQRRITPEEGNRRLIETLASARSVAVVSGLESGSLSALFGEFVARFPRGRYLTYEPLVPTSMASAAELLFGRREIPRLHLDQATYVVSLGADLLDSYLSPVEHARDWADGHDSTTGRRLEVDYFGPRRNLTATAADRWHRVAPADLGELALALAHDLYDTQKGVLDGAAHHAVAQLLDKLGPRPEVAAVPAAIQNQLGIRLTSGRPVAVVYGGAEATTNQATSIHLAVLLCNFLVGAIGHTWRFGEGYALSAVSPSRDVLAALGDDQTDVVILHGVNPAYSLPGGRDALAGAKPLVVALAAEENETTRLADLVLPIHHPLESWGDYEVAAGARGLMQPVRAPLYPTSQHVGDLLLATAAGLGKPFAILDYRMYVAQRWLAGAALADPTAPPADLAVTPTGDERAVPGEPPPSVLDRPLEPPAPLDLRHDRRWEKLLMEGGDFTAPAAPTQPMVSSSAPGGAKLLPGVGAPLLAGEGAVLLAPATAALYDGRSATATWLIETPDSLTQTAWEIPLEVAADVASAAGVGTGDRVQVTTERGSVTARVFLDPELLPGTIALRMGGGRHPDHRRHPDRTVGASVIDLLGPTVDGTSGELAWTQTRATVRRLAGGELIRVSGGTDSHDRFLCLAMTTSDLRRGRFPVLTRHGDHLPEPGEELEGKLVMPMDEVPGTRPDDNIVTLQPHPEHRWGMVVDLDKCIGCGACAVACMAENNIPVVGADEVSRGRELSWIRIERHDFPDQPGPVRFLPVMCQHCDNAPCEPVCPVFAAYHTPDGLNGQIYNRCVGTRYCSNNCPYKARRFNWFDYPRPKPGNQQLNPDVTVRSRGVMEKCTMCVQRIRAVTNRAKASGATIADGEIKTACQQTCPTGAITFGDFKQASWQMTKLAGDPRAYRLLDYAVNTRPGIVYLRKVITTDDDATPGSGDKHGGRP